jgi:predicted dehydrogenase
VQKEIADVAFVHLRFASGVIAHAELSWLAPSKLRRTVVVGARRMLLYDDTETTEKIKLFDRGVSLRDPETFGEFQLSYRLGDILSPHLDPVEPLALEMDDFLRAITTGASPLADGYSGLKAVLVMEAAERSLQNGGREEVIDGQIVEGPAGSPRR